jgi:hypothetical protein
MTTIDEFVTLLEQHLDSCEDWLRKTIVLRHLLDEAPNSERSDLLQILQYLQHVEFDFSLLMINFVKAKTPAQRIAYAKFVCLLIFESLDDLIKLLGKRCRDFFSSIGATNDQLKRLSQIHKELNAYSRKHDILLRQIRNFAAAHRQHDYLDFESITQQFSVEQLAITFREFALLLHGSVPILSELFAEVLLQSRK